MMTKIKQPLKWYGGKYYLAKRIIAQMPPHIHYVEPYFGGGSVLLQKDPTNTSEVVNDLHAELTTFWRVLQHPGKFERFKRIIDAMPFSVVEWEHARLRKDNEVGRAVRFFVRCRQSHLGSGSGFAILSRNRIRRGMNEQVSAWMSAVDGLADVAERMRRVVILCSPAVDVIRSQDGPNTLFYLDPPYLPTARVTVNAYNHEMSRDDHAEMLDAVRRCCGCVMLSGYPNDLYAFALKGWHTFDIKVDNKASSRKVKRTMTERVWCNFTP